MGHSTYRRTSDGPKPPPITTVGLAEVQLMTGLSSEGVRRWTEAGHVVKLGHGVYDLPGTVKALMAKARAEGAQDGGSRAGGYDLDEEKARKEHFLANEAEHRLALAQSKSVSTDTALGWVAELITNWKSEIRGMDITADQKRALMGHLRSVKLPGVMQGQIALDNDAP